MPFMKCKVNFPIVKEKEILLKKSLGQAVEIFPGITEVHLLAVIEDNCKIYLRGESEIPCAYIEVSIFANEKHFFDAEFSKIVTEIFTEIFNISTRNIYIKFEDIAAFGADKMFFDRNDENAKKKITILHFNDPMMGLSYELEPIFRKLETHFGEKIIFKNVMSVLVKNVLDFVNPADLSVSMEFALEKYLVKLAKIYEDEEKISGMPILMKKCKIFSAKNMTRKKRWKSI